MGQKFQDSTAIYQQTWTSSTAQNTTLAAYGWGYCTAVVTVQVTGTVTGGALTFQGYDGYNWYPLSGTELYTGALDTSYSLASGNVAIGCEITGLSQFRVVLGTVISGSGSVQVTINESAASISSIVKAAAIKLLDSGGSNVASVTSGGALLVQQNAGVSGGWTPSSRTSLTNSAVAIKTTAGQVGGLDLYNPGASAAYVQFFNATTGNVTLGSTTPAFVKAIPAGAAANINWGAGIAFNTAISWAATSTATGSGAPASSLTGFALYA